MAGGDTVYGVTLRDKEVVLGYIYSTAEYSLTNVERQETYLIEVYADEQLTERPQPGATYNEIYVKFSSLFNQNDTYTAPGAGFKQFVYYPEDGEDPAEFRIWEDWFSLGIEQGDRISGEAYPARNENAQQLPDEFTIRFGRIV